MKRNKVKKVGILCFLLFLFGLPIISSAVNKSLSDGLVGLKISTSADFYAISESDLTTRWILQNSTLTAVENFIDDISGANWNLDDVSEDSFYASLDDSYLFDNATESNIWDYTGVHFDVGARDYSPMGITWDGTYFWILGVVTDEVYKYTSTGTYTGVHFNVGFQDGSMQGIVWDGSDFWIVGDDTEEVYKYNAGGTYTGVHFDVAAQEVSPQGIAWDGSDFWVVGELTDEVYKYNATGVYQDVHFDISSEDMCPKDIVWDGSDFWVVGDLTDEIYQYNITGDYTGVHFDVAVQDTWMTGITWDGTYFWFVGVANEEVYKYENIYDVFKNYQGAGHMYMQTNTTELISLKSTDYETHYNLSSGDYFKIDFQTNADSLINLILLKDGVVNKTLILSPSGNTNFNRHTVQISVDEFVEFDQLKISSTFEDEDYIKVYDIKTYKYTVVGDYADFYVGSRNAHSVNLTSDTYNLRIFEEGDEKINEDITIRTSDYFYVYTPIMTQYCRLTLFNTDNIHLEFIDYHIQINRSLNGEYNQFWLLDSLFSVDKETYVYISVYDRFNTLINTFERLASDYIDLELEVYQLQIKNLMEQKTTVDINATHVYPLLSGESIYFMLSKAYYQIRFLDEYNSYINFNIYLSSNQAYQLNSSLKTIYFSMFTYDGLGISHDLVRFYINSERKDLGFNSMLEDTLELVILDFFNNTLANETIDANAYDNSEYNLFVEIYSLIILNQFTYEDIIVNITQVDSGVWMTQIIPKQFGLTYRFLSNVEYNITIYFTNETLYTSRIVNLTSNSHIESFGVPTTTSEYPKNVYFSIYTGTGLAIQQQKVKFYIDGDRADFGFNTIESMIVTLTVKDFFNTTLFNQNVNTSGIYEYDILINIYSLKIKNEAQEIANYTLKLGALNDTGNILPEEIIEYQLATNNYVFDYTNNEDGSLDTININLNQDRVYILNSTYYNIYFSLFDQNGVRLDDSLFSLYINGTRKDFGFIELETVDVLIVVQDRLNYTAFNSVITLSEFTEYNIIITVYEFQIRHLGQENSNLTLYETTTHNYINFSMSPDSLNKYVLSGSTYNITWINGENSISTIYYITLNKNYILTLDSTYYNIYFSLYDLNLHNIDPNQYVFRLNGTIRDFGLITDLQTDDYTITITDRFGISLFNMIVNLRGLNEYRINISLYELQIRHLASENSNLILTEDVLGNSHSFIMTPDSIKCILISSSNYTLNWTNGENNQLTSFSIDLILDSVVKLNTTYYDVYIGLYNFYDVVNTKDVKLYIDNTRADFGFNTITSDYVDLLVLDYFNSTLYHQIVRLKGLNEHSIFIEAYTLVVNNLYNNQSITIKITRGTITLERLLEAQGWTEFKLFANTKYEIISYVNGTMDEEKEVVLDEEYKVVDFGFFKTELSIMPEPITPPDISPMLLIVIIVSIVIGIVVIYFVRKGANRTTKATTEGRYLAFESFGDTWRMINKNKIVLAIIFILVLIGFTLFFMNILR